MNYPDIGPCFLTINELEIPNHQLNLLVPGQGNTRRNMKDMTWAYSMDHQMKTYRINSNRIWKIMAFQKDTMKHYVLLLTDSDLQSVYPFFTKNEKLFYELFRLDKIISRKERLECLAVLGKKIGFRKTDVGTIMILETLRKPAFENSDLYVPLKEFIRQKTLLSDIMSESASTKCIPRQAQYFTNARHPVLQTSVKFQERYLNIIVYFMIPLSIFTFYISSR